MVYDATARKREMPEVFPRRFGKYVLLKSLARGGMGEIYVAATGEPGFQKFCVIKKVIAERTDKAKANRFLDEAKVVLRLSHANLVPTFDAGEIDGEFYIAMELVEGKDLRDIWNRCVRTRTRIPLDVALHVGREIARALAYVHSYGDLKLVHRDVAPPNILMSYFGEVKLTDFGLARSVLKQEHTAPGVVFGRAAYLAPEQARGEVADARSDIYSLGVVIWELLTGHQYLQLQNVDAATAMSLVRHPNTQAPSSKAAWITPSSTPSSCARSRRRARTATGAPRRCGRRCPTSSPACRRAPTPSARPSSCAGCAATPCARSRPTASACWVRASASPCSPRTSPTCSRPCAATASRGRPPSTRASASRRTRTRWPSSSRGPSCRAPARRPPISPGASSRAATASCASSARAAWAPCTPPSTSRSARAWR